MVAIRVRDTGLGIAPDLLPHVFDLFTQADRTLDRAEGGLGIGLTLVKRLVEMHGGTRRGAQRRARERRGVHRALAGARHGAAHANRCATLHRRGDAVRRATDARSLRILIVDDNVDAADSIAMLLSMEGHETRTVNTARAALLAVPEFEPEWCCSTSACRRWMATRSRAACARRTARMTMRLVAVTGYGQPADRRRAQAAGFDEHLVKPVEPAAA